MLSETRRLRPLTTVMRRRLVPLVLPRQRRRNRFSLSVSWNIKMILFRTSHLLHTSWRKCTMEILCGAQQLLGMKKDEKEFMTLSSACHGDVNWYLLIDVGFFVCFDSFLSLLTVMPTRMVMTIWRLLKTREFKRPSTIELSDFGCFLIMACGVTVLQQIDISLIYHMIRGQATIKLYVIYNVLEIFDKLCQTFIGDVLQMLFHSAEELARCPPDKESTRFWIWRFISDQVLAVVTSIVHSFILLVQAITLSACIVAHYNALPALLVSNNFSEIKSYVFKGYSKDNVHSMVYSDSIERFHISAFVLFVLAQNILEAEGPWFESFLINILLVYLFEMAIDVIKHSFIAKFNNIAPIAYSEFLEVLCKQTLHMQTEGARKKLTFVPLAPACVVIRVLTPVYAANLPYNSLPWRLSGILLFSALTYVMLTSLKVLTGMILQKHARWYVNRCQRRKHHLHAD
ncbi:protein POLLEN DEFECTIVE IN GUIDANCE 1 isoform X2 [Cajanus cajan]|uniref:protein POLLEN DEFECTIVE IN GUIDANCE 1 isoform X2 n=1 Tax=Cajanus cajan TaxID=3821 RepID=UPI00098DCDB4|nr:protein POLLEN DEFECTIVE IN GUIDANCE 1 isoform X2 [Cajanus cajan]